MMDLPHVLTVVVSLTGISIVLSAIGCVVAFYQTGRSGLTGFIRYCLPPGLLCRSCYQDVGFVLLKQLTRPWTRALFQLLTSSQCALATYMLLVFAFGPRTQGAIFPVQFGILLLAAVLIQDFLRFGNHYWLHRIGVLWDAHKVHHSASFLTPLTNHRAHIIEEVIQQASTGLVIGPLLGVTAFMTSTSIGRISLLGFDAYALIDTLCFGVLRHSHIGLSFGWLELYLMSPKQHQMHHSVDPNHWNRNFGFLFSFWDRMAGTICYSNPQEKITVGIVSDIADYDSVLKLYFMPYIKIWRRLSPSLRGQRRAIPSSSAARPSASSTVKPPFDDDFAAPMRRIIIENAGHTLALGMSYLPPWWRFRLYHYGHWCLLGDPYWCDNKPRAFEWTRVRPHGYEMELSCADWMERYAIHTGAFYSGEVIAAVSAILRPGDCLVDIGANIGFVALCASSVVGAGGQVFALEPNTTLLARLNGMLVHNCISNVETLPFAAGDKTGCVGFSQEPHHGNNHIVTERARAPKTVPMRRVDDLLRDRLPIRKTIMVKIDVEGAELIVLRGMPALIQRPATVFLIEVSDSRLRENGSSGEELLDLMRSSGYSPFLPSFSPRSFGLRMQPLNKLTRPNKTYDVLFRRDSAEARLAIC